MTSSTRCRSSGWVAPALLLSAWAHAAPTPVSPEFRQHLKEAVKAYDLAHFDESLKLFSETYKLRPLPAILFNIAQCHLQLGNFERPALFYPRQLSPPPP